MRITRSKPTKESKGQRIIRELRGLSDALKSGRPVEEQYTVRTYRHLPTPSEYDPKQIRRTREALGASQAVFADVVGVSASLVRSWEHGFRKPSKMACRLLDEINRSRGHWRGMMASA